MVWWGGCCVGRAGCGAGVGGWERDLVTGHSAWTVQMQRIHETEPGVVPVMRDALDFYEPHARPLIHKAVARAVQIARSKVAMIIA